MKIDPEMLHIFSEDAIYILYIYIASYIIVFTTYTAYS